MKKAIDWEKDISEIITKINVEFPELSKYISEMPIKISEENNETVNSKNLEEYYHSLVEIVNKYSNSHSSSEAINQDLPGYPIYPASEDIYNTGKVDEAINPENISKNKTANEEAISLNEKGFKDDMTGDDLDIPGSELDDQEESVGSEDEENNYYSLGGDNHNDLEEDKG